MFDPSYFCGDVAVVAVPPDAVEVPRRGVLPRRRPTAAVPAVATPARAHPPDGVPRKVVPVKVACVIGATTWDNPTVTEDGEERGALLLPFLLSPVVVESSVAV